MNESQGSNNKLLKVFYDHKDFALLESSREVIRKYQKSPLPDIEYMICITPRSGSSWLTEILSKTQILGKPEEWFNPGNLPGIVRSKFPCIDIPEYYDCIKRTQCTENKVFGLEASFFQYQMLSNALDECRHELSLSLPNLKKLKVIYLYRMDLVSQAVSLFRAVQTGMFHSVQKDASEKQSLDFDYSEDSIWQWLTHILQQEFGWQSIFRKYSVLPLILTYEELWSNPNLTKLRIANHIFNDSNSLNHFEENYGSYNHVKIADSKSSNIVSSFYKRNANKIDFCIQNRGKIDSKTIVKELNLNFI